jgi:hypothetical protein
VFHFLTVQADRDACRGTRRSLKHGGSAIWHLRFGPPRCSGLDVVRYDASGIQRALDRNLS